MRLNSRAQVTKMSMKKKDDKQSFNGLRHNSNYIKRFIATAVVFVMLFESGISPWISFAPAYAYAAEDEGQGAYISADAASDTSQDTQYDAAGAGTEEQTGPGESASQGSETEEKKDDEASGGITDGEASGETPSGESGTEGGEESGKTPSGESETETGTETVKDDDGSGQSDIEDTKEDEEGVSDKEESETDKTDAGKDAEKDKKASDEEDEEDIGSETESELTSDDDHVKLTFDSEAGIPRGADVRVEEIYGGEDYDAYVNAALEASALSTDQIAGLKVLDISIVNNGRKINPGNSVSVEINADYLFGEKALYSDDEVLAVQVDSDDARVLGTEINSGEDENGNDAGYEDGAIWSEDGDPERALPFTKKADSVSFSTGEFSVFVFIQPIQEKIVTATDESSYEITAFYDNASGIPAGTELKIEETAQGSGDMQHYYEECAALFDESVYSVEAIRAFDISFADLETEDEYEPDKEIGLSIKLLSDGLIDGAECRLVRFDGAAEEMGFGLDTEEQTLSFDAGDMSVYGVVQLAVKKQLRAGDGSTYEVTVYYDSVSGIPDNAVLSVSEITEEDEGFDGYVERSSDEVDNAPGTVKVARAFDISLINPDTGEEYQPIKPVQVNIELPDENLEDCESLDVVHIHGESEEQTELLESSVNEGAIEFESEGFSVYVVVKTVKAKTLTASDGRKYSVTVYYDSDSGIPEDAELVVNEIPEGSDEYLRYLDKSADALGKKPEYLDMARAFDISFTDPTTGEKYQPTKDVSVNIRLLNDDLSNYVYVDVVHFPEESTNGAVVMDSSDKVGSVEFKTDGFSVYVLTGSSHLGTFYFFSINNYGDYQGYMFTDDKGNQVNSQTIKDGEKLVAPLNPSGDPDNPREFKGWYKGDSENSLESEPFDFTKPQTFTEDTSVNLYAVFADYAYVTFHDRYDSSTQSYPVAETRRVELLNNAPGTLNISDVSVSYHDSNAVNGMPGYVFYGWSETPIQKPDEGKDSDRMDPTISVSGNMDLYPMFKQVHWLSFISGNSGTGATYYAPVAVEAGERLTESVINSSYIPKRQGYSFTGWYLGVTDEGTDAQNGTGTKITDDAGTLLPVQDYDKGIQVFPGSDAYLLLSKNVTLYAGWQAGETDVTVVIRKQRATDENDLTDDKKTYDYAESFTLKSQPGSSIQVVSGTGSSAGAVTEGALAGYEALNDNAKYNIVHPDAQLAEGVDNPYKGYSFNAAKTLTDTDKSAGTDTGSKKVSGDGTTVINLYYDKDSSVTPAEGSFKLTFHFTESADGSDKPVENVVSGTKLSAVPGCPQPAGTTPEGQEFGWYYDPGCTTPVNFDTDTMPDHDLILYGGRTKKWYLIQIDPNYGDLNGKGSTYFWKTYQSDYIQEYTWVTRDYVPSGSGQYYYVNHDYDYAKTDPDSDRLSYYTTEISEATELTTFKESKGEYLYDGWYQVNDDGTETPYTFGQPIEGDTTLRLHWKKTGTYYLQYNADVTVDGKRLAGRISDNSVSPDPSGYSDKSDVILNSYADAPDGYSFTGWQVRDDDSGTVYNPGDSFIINGEQAVTVNGKKTIYLDAVYTRIKTATIIYNANGGTISAGADGGYPYRLGTDGKPVMNDEGKPINLNTHVVTKSSDSELTVSGLTNNSPINLSSGDGFSYSFTDESGSQAQLTLSGWNTKSDGSGTHYDLGSYKDSKRNYYYVDTTEPVTLYAEWKVTVYFDKNSETYPGAAFSTSGWSDYTPISDTEDPHYGQYSIETTVGALLKEPADEVTSEEPALNFDFWSTKKDGDQTNAFDFANTKVTGSMTLYAHLADVVKVPYHVVSSNKVDRDEWRKTDKLRVQATAIDMSTGDSFSEYVTPVSAEYTYAYACLSNSAENISDSDASKIVSLSLDTDKKVTVTFADNTTVVLNDGKTDDGRKIYLVYSADNADARVKLAYVKEGQGGALSVISPIRYNDHEFSTLNGSLHPSILSHTIAENGSISGETVTGQVLTLSEDPLEISQRMAQGVFNAPPMLDDPGKTDGALSLVYDSFGVGASNAANVSGVAGKSQTLYLRYYDGRRQWSADKNSWTILDGDTLYVIFRERGNELRITKAVTGDNTKLDPNMSFKVTVTSTAITHSDYKTEGTGHASVPAVPADGFKPGSITLTVKDGSDIHIKDLPNGEYTITEEHNSNFTLEAKADGATADVEVSEGSGSVKVTVEADRKVELFNKPYEICRVFNEDLLEGKTFYTLNSALEYIRNNMDGCGDIEMLRDYVIPEWDALEIPTGFDITLTSDTRTSQRYTISRDDSFVSGAMFTNNGKFTIENITLDGDQVSTESAIVSNKGQLTIDAGAVLQNAAGTGDGGAISQERGSLTVRNGATFKDNKATNGGAISVSAGSVSIEGGTFSGNTATNGGALYYSGSSTMTVSGGTFSGNTATNGGSIYTVSGNITVSGGSFTGSYGEDAAYSATNGGAIYSEKATLTLRGGTFNGIKAQQNGGAVYAQAGNLTLSGSTFTGNNSISGNGGAVYSESGNISITGGTISGNSAATGKGGALWLGSGRMEMSSGTISGSNSAINGAAIFVQSGHATLSGGSVTGNTASEGGAIGVGSADARLVFSGGIQVKNNVNSSLPEGNQRSNIYLDQDSDDVITISGLNKTAAIGVYVADNVIDTRGVPGAKFGSYTNDTNKYLITNDRDPSFTVVSEASSKKLYWGMGIKVEVRYQPNSFMSKGFPPKDIDYTFKTINTYYPVVGDNGYVALSALAEDLYKNNADVRDNLLKETKTAAYAGAFIKKADATYNDYLIKLSWDKTNDRWILTKWDNSTMIELGTDTLLIYYAEPAYIAVENNTNMPLDISDIVMGSGENTRSVVNRSGVVGYGMTYAKNGAVRKELLPIEVDDLKLAAGASVTLIIPGGRNTDYTLTGSFNSDGTTQEVRLRRSTSSAAEQEEKILGLTAAGEFATLGGEALSNSSFTGKTLDKAGTYHIIFGDDKKICKIRTTTIASGALDPDKAVTDREIAGYTLDGAETEYLFTTLTQAMEFVKTYMQDAPYNKTASIEMLTDYLLPSTDRLQIPEGYHITLTTALDGKNFYTPATVGENRATISRDQENTEAMLTATGKADYPAGTTFDITNLIIDGKSVRGSSDGGGVSTTDCNVTVDNVKFENIYAGNGGAIFVAISDKKYHGKKSSLTVRNSVFISCHSSKTGSRDGGGAIHAYVDHLTLEDSTFTSCEADWQAGAVFHKVELENKKGDTSSTVSNCTFTSCESKAAGGMELGSHNIQVSGCTFEHCIATNRNGGGFNVYALNHASPTVECHTTVTDCTFIDCHVTGTNPGNGGGFRSTSTHTTISNTTFNNTSAKFGGAVALSNEKAVKAEVIGCSINDARSVNNGNGGGIFSYAKEFIVSDSQITNCTSQGKGGAIYHKRDAEGTSLTVTNTDITGNSCTANTGGGVAVENVLNATFTRCTISDNIAKSDGGGIWIGGKGTAANLIVDNSFIRNNSSGGIGGGIYSNANLTLRNDTNITENSITSTPKDASDNAGGTYITDNCKLIMGTTGATALDLTTVKGNTDGSGAPSDLRLWWDKSSRSSENYSVLVRSSLGGEIRVVNPGKPMEQFGTRDANTYAGFTEGSHVFIADTGGLYGVFDRSDPEHKELIWRGGVVCKITDASGHLLYLDPECKDPAVFDRLDYEIAGSKLSPFSYLRQDNPVLYRKGGALIDLSQEEICVKLLVDTYETDTNITTGSYPGRKLITLTTASSTDTDGYPYTGRAGTYAMIRRGYSDDDKPMIETGVNLTLKNITLDGASTDKADPKVFRTDGGLIKADTNGIKVTLAANSVLQNSRIRNEQNGGGIYVGSGASLLIAGGAIYNCGTEYGNGGAVYMNGDGSFEFTSGNISKCFAKNGGGVYFDGGSSFDMSGSAQIKGCTASENGGGVYLNDKRIMKMTGGSITGNHAGSGGGGIYLGNDNETRLNLSGRVTISGNTADKDENGTGNPKSVPCNVELVRDTNDIINSQGISRNSHIGVYVSGVESPGDNPEDKDITLYDRHGLEGKPFGKYTGITDYLYCFVNDRNGLKGGLKLGDTTTIYWVRIFSLQVSKTVISGEENDLNDEFEFRVTFSKQEGGAQISGFNHYFTYDDGRLDDGGEPEKIPITDGFSKFKLKNGDVVTVDDLPAEIDNGGKVYYKVEEVLTPGQAGHYKTTTLRSSAKKVQQNGESGSSSGTSGNQSEKDRIVSGTIGENLYREDVSSKYTSYVVYDNTNAICKLTSSKNGGVLLYTLDPKTDKPIPAVYSALYRGNAASDKDKPIGAFDVIDHRTDLYYFNEFTNKYEKYDYDGTDILSVEMLIEEYEMKKAVLIKEQGTNASGSKGINVTLTTADPKADDGYPYVGTAGTNAKIKRGFNRREDAMFMMENSSGSGSALNKYPELTLKNITLDGNKEKNYYSTGKAGIVRVNDYCRLVITDGAILENSRNTDKGGAAVYIGAKAEAEMNGGTVRNNECKGNAVYGAAFYVSAWYENGVGYGAKLTLSGSPVITGNTSESKGPGIYLHAVTKGTAKLYISGSPQFSGNNGGAGDGNTGDGSSTGGLGSIDETCNTVTMSGYADKSNGHEKVYNGGKVRQDIYIAEKHENAPESIIVNGLLDGTPGSIWVWAENDVHYLQLMPFAKIEGVKYSESPSLPESEYNSINLKVFRNARDDEATMNGTSSYLYGTIRDELPGYVFWNGVEGSAHVILVKVQDAGAKGYYKALSGKKFRVYSNNDKTVPAKGTTLDDNGEEADIYLAPLAEGSGGTPGGSGGGTTVITTDWLESGDGGAFFIGELPYGTYYVEEKDVSGVFVITIDKGGVVNITNPDTEPKTTEPVKTVELSTP